MQNACWSPWFILDSRIHILLNHAEKNSITIRDLKNGENALDSCFKKWREPTLRDLKSIMFLHPPPKSSTSSLRKPLSIRKRVKMKWVAAFFPNGALAIGVEEHVHGNTGGPFKMKPKLLPKRKINQKFN